MTQRRDRRIRWPRPLPRWGRRCVRRKDSGQHTVEFAIVAGPLLMVTFMVIQVGLVFYARATALAAATQGANAARAYGSSPQVGKTKAEEFLAALGGGLRESDVTVTDTGTTVTVTVTGKAPPMIPFLTFDISQTASGPIERFVE